MSDTYLRVIPDDPDWVPTAERANAAMQLIAALRPGCTVTIRSSDEIEFVDPGENFERVLCPKCGADLTNSWQSVMDEAWKTKFSNLGFEAPCCRTPGNLNQLVYEWPAGFARFVLEASGLEAGQFLTPDALESIAESIGFPVRQVLSRY